VNYAKIETWELILLWGRDTGQLSDFSPAVSSRQSKMCFCIMLKCSKVIE